MNNDINYSGQYLDNKEFRIKVRTGEDIANVTGSAICGEIFLTTGASPAMYIATETSTESTSSIYKVQNLTGTVS
jgi:hypothetical protein